MFASYDIRSDLQWTIMLPRMENPPDMQTSGHERCLVILRKLTLSSRSATRSGRTALG